MTNLDSFACWALGVDIPREGASGPSELQLNGPQHYKQMYAREVDIPSLASAIRVLTQYLKAGGRQPARVAPPGPSPRLPKPNCLQHFISRFPFQIALCKLPFKLSFMFLDPPLYNCFTKRPLFPSYVECLKNPLKVPFIKLLAYRFPCQVALQEICIQFGNCFSK